MKTLQSLTAALLIVISSSAMANDSVGAASMDINTKSVAAPAFSWGSPNDLNLQTVERLKYLPVTAPALDWGTPEDLNEADLEVLKVRDGVSLSLPAFSWGSPEDLDMQALSDLKSAVHTISCPAIVIGNADEIDASDLKKK